jgi:hypothetical protein
MKFLFIIFNLKLKYPTIIKRNHVIIVIKISLLIGLYKTLALQY